MEYTSLIQQAPIAQPESQSVEKKVRVFMNFLSGSVTALAIYVFFVALPFWIFWEETYFEFIGKVDSIIGLLIPLIGVATATGFESKRLSLSTIEKYQYWMNAIIRYT